MAKNSQKITKEPIERLVLKLPKSVAAYFRSAFQHGKRSRFVADCLAEHRKNEQLRRIEEEFREIGRRRE